MCIVFLPNPPITILVLLNCLIKDEWLTFLKRCFWLVRQESNNHVTMKFLSSFCLNQNKNIDNDLYCNILMSFQTFFSVTMKEQGRSWRSCWSCWAKQYFSFLFLENFPFSYKIYAISARVHLRPVYLYTAKISVQTRPRDAIFCFVIGGAVIVIQKIL